MSAALTLPYVWATVYETPVRRRFTALPISGLAFYRKHTESLLRRYLRASFAVGRVPSVMGDITLRGRVSSYHMKNFEDVVIFTIDVEKCMKALEPYALQLVVKVALQEYTLEEAGEQFRQNVRVVTRNYGEALDLLTAEFLKRNLLAQEGKKCVSRGGCR
jgi:hypothetical protein